MCMAYINTVYHETFNGVIIYYNLKKLAALNLAF